MTKYEFKGYGHIRVYRGKMESFVGMYRSGQYEEFKEAVKSLKDGIVTDSTCYGLYYIIDGELVEKGRD